MNYELLCKNIHQYKKHDNNCNDFNGGFYCVMIEKVKHKMVVLVSGCKIA